MPKVGKFEEIRRSPPAAVEEHQRWAPFAMKGATLADLRQLCSKTQEEVGRAMGISGVEAGRMEKRPDVQVSTLVRFLSALGGELEVYARFGEKLVPLKIGEFNPSTLVDLIARGCEEEGWTKETKVEAILEAYRKVYPLQPAPTLEQVQDALMSVRGEFARERKRPDLARIADHLLAQTRQ